MGASVSETGFEVGSFAIDIGFIVDGFAESGFAVFGLFVIEIGLAVTGFCVGTGLLVIGAAV